MSKDNKYKIPPELHKVSLGIIEGLLEVCNQANWNMNAVAAARLTGIMALAKQHVRELKQQQEETTDE
jgi:hypothetical protein